MIETVSEAPQATLARFAEIIDVRSPAEYADDHVPGAINLPVLNDEERARVGTIYVQESRLKARRLGAAIVARNIAGHLEGALADKDGAYAPLLYCWRGGQRSAAMASVLSQVGWRVAVLEGGYKRYRAGVMRALYEPGAAVLRIVLLDGDTGTAKTDILRRLPGLGLQILDLEALACHRGSLFGAIAGEPQPSQRLFESRLAEAMARLDARAPVVVEAESSRIGDLMIPPRLWRAMAGAPAIVVAAPMAERARYLVSAYADLTEDLVAIEAAIDRLPRHLSKAEREAWKALARERRFAELAEGLMAAHYDPAYRRSTLRRPVPPLTTVDMAALDDPGRAAAARHVVAALASFPA